MKKLTATTNDHHIEATSTMRAIEVAALIENRLALYDETCTEPNSDIMAKDILDEGHLMPDLPGPTYFSSHDTAVWKDGDDEVTLDEDGSIGVTSRDRTTDQARSLAYRILAAIDFSERTNK